MSRCVSLPAGHDIIDCLINGATMKSMVVDVLAVESHNRLLQYHSQTASLSDPHSIMSIDAQYTCAVRRVSE